MTNEGLANEVMDYLTSRRTASVGNIALRCNCDVEALFPIIEFLESEQRLRRAFSRCQSGCASCSGCESDLTTMPLSDRTIVISLESARQEF